MEFVGSYQWNCVFIIAKMSVSLGAENTFVLDVFAYYHRLYEWKRKVKRSFRSKLLRSSSSVGKLREQDNNKCDVSSQPFCHAEPVRAKKTKRLSRSSSLRYKVLTQAGKLILL